MPIFRRLGRLALRGLSLPLQMTARMTTQSALFLGLALTCGVLSLASSPWSNIPLLMCLVLLSLWVLAFWHGSRALRGLQVRRNYLERTFANETVPVTLNFSNESPWPCSGLAISEPIENDDPTPAPDERSKPRMLAAVGGTFVTLVAGQGHARATYGLRMRRRGVYRFGETVVRTEAPLGLFRSSVSRLAPGRLVVYPRLGEVDSSFFKELDLALDHIRRFRPSRAEEDFRGLREYRKGDNPKWIHWRSSARVQKLLVKEFEEPQARRVLLLMDTNLQRIGAQRFAAFETAISFAGTLVRDLARRGCEIECVGLQPPDRVARALISRDRRNLDSLLELLASFKRDDRRTLAHLVEHVRRRSLHRVFVLVLGMGSLRARVELDWLNTGDNAIRIIDIRGDEFRRIFHRAPSTAKDTIADDDLLISLGDEEGSSDELAAVPAGERTSGE
ncbi:MAG TPA: DUF58 domain-containing protein [Planctomycetota bacterium]|jgi:uncharacterized protein (DUF58 family)